MVTVLGFPVSTLAHQCASSVKKGYFEPADGGTIFLDEIGELPLALQAKLLRVLEGGEVTPIGATRAGSVWLRIIAATHVDLPRKIDEARDRRDLYFRLMHFNLAARPAA